MIKVLEEMMQVSGTPGGFQDLMYAAILLADMTIHEFEESHKKFHPLTVKEKIEPFRKDLPPTQNWFDAIVKLIEEHEGVDAPHEKLRPQVGTPGYIIALLNQLLRLKSVEIV
jgi:hypothetical protein